jgi:hypothetical protein
VTALLPLKLARPDEIPLLERAGYEIAAPWDDSFTLMRLGPVERHNAAILRDNQAREQWRDTYGERAG